MSIYLNPKVDLTFKKVFGEHQNLVKSLLNAFLPLPKGMEIVSVEYLTACPPNAEIRKTALGAEQSVEWEHCADSIAAVNALKSDGYTIIAIEQAKESVMIDRMDLQSYPKVALIFGNEVKGVDDRLMSLCDLCVEIPQFGTKHSLYVSVSAGIAIWEVFKQKGTQ